MTEDNPEELKHDMIDLNLDELDKIKIPTKQKHIFNLTPITRNNTDQEILDMIGILGKWLTEPRIVTDQDTVLWFWWLGSEQAIMNYKTKRNEVINTEIDRLQRLLVQGQSS